MQLPLEKVRRMTRTMGGVLSTMGLHRDPGVVLLEVGLCVCHFHRKLLGLSSEGHVSKMGSEEDDQLSLHPPGCRILVCSWDTGLTWERTELKHQTTIPAWSSAYRWLSFRQRALTTMSAVCWGLCVPFATGEWSSQHSAGPVGEESFYRNQLIRLALSHRNIKWTTNIILQNSRIYYCC